MSDTGVYLYAVAKDLDPSALDGAVGVAGSPVRAVSGAGFTALASTVGLEEFGEEALRQNLEKLSWLEAVARAHHTVVTAAARAAATAPVRIATVYRTDERVRELLRARGSELAAVLRRVTGRAEWGVKVIASAEETETEPEPAGAAADRPGTAYLSRRRAQRRSRQESTQRLAEQAQRVETELTPYAAASRRHRLQDPALSGHKGRMTLNIAYLLDHDRAESLLAAARELENRLPATRIEVTGPWPAYSFTDWEATP